jgi:hypothetical protein
VDRHALRAAATERPETEELENERPCIGDPRRQSHTLPAYPPEVQEKHGSVERGGGTEHDPSGHHAELARRDVRSAVSDGTERSHAARQTSSVQRRASLAREGFAAGA